MAAVRHQHNIPDVDFDPSNYTLAESIGMTPADVRPIIEELLEAGWVQGTPSFAVGHVDGGVRPTHKGLVAMGRRVGRGFWKG